MTTQPVGCFRTSPSGNLHDLQNPDKNLILLEDIAHHLSRICRFNGGTSRHYSVAEHSIRVAMLCPEPMRYAALLHDAAEAYLGDVPRGLKRLIASLYRPLEQAWEKAIGEKFGVDPSWWHDGVIKQIDNAMCATEGLCFVNGYQPVTAAPVPDYSFSGLWTQFGWRTKFPDAPDVAWLFLKAVKEFLAYAK